MNPYETIRLTAANLAPNESVRGVCPWCYGGRTREESFIITREGSSAKYICHRASCGGRRHTSGSISISGEPLAANFRPAKVTPDPKILFADTFPLSEESLANLYDRFQFTPEVIQAYGLTETDEGDIIIPIYNARGIQQGHERKVKVPIRAKSIRYDAGDADGMGWFNHSPEYHLPEDITPRIRMERGHITDAIILVEDVYSAMKANYFMHSLALLGTYLSPEQAVSIAGEKYRTVLIALDADASARAVGIMRRYAAIFPDVRVIKLTRDIKDMPYVDVSKLLYTRY